MLHLMLVMDIPQNSCAAIFGVTPINIIMSIKAPPFHEMN